MQIRMCYICVCVTHCTRHICSPIAAFYKHAPSEVHQSLRHQKFRPIRHTTQQLRAIMGAYHTPKNTPKDSYLPHDVLNTVGQICYIGCLTRAASNNGEEKVEMMMN